MMGKGMWCEDTHYQLMECNNHSMGQAYRLSNVVLNVVLTSLSRVTVLQVAGLWQWQVDTDTTNHIFWNSPVAMVTRELPDVNKEQVVGQLWWLPQWLGIIGLEHEELPKWKPWKPKRRPSGDLGNLTSWAGVSCVVVCRVVTLWRVCLMGVCVLCWFVTDTFVCGNLVFDDIFHCGSLVNDIGFWLSFELMDFV